MQAFYEQAVYFLESDIIEPPLEIPAASGIVFSFWPWSEISKVCRERRVWGGMHFAVGEPRTQQKLVYIIVAGRPGEVFRRLQYALPGPRHVYTMCCHFRIRSEDALCDRADWGNISGVSKIILAAKRSHFSRALEGYLLMRPLRLWSAMAIHGTMHMRRTDAAVQ